MPPDNLPFLFAAFAVVWAVFFIYAAYMSWRRQSVQRELRELEQAIELADELEPDQGDRNEQV